jgi:Glycosyl hydrolase family 79 C-terminal beta domain
VYKKMAALVAVGVTVLATASPSSANTARSLVPAADPTTTDVATVVVDSAHPAGRLNGDAVGLSFEVRELAIGNLDSERGNVAQMFRTLGRSNVRIGGNTLDRDTSWIPQGSLAPVPAPDWVKSALSPNDIRRFRDLLDETGWNSIVAINAGRPDLPKIADEAKSLTRILGHKLYALGCGNEPDQWVGRGYKPAPFDYTQYHTDWAQCADVTGSTKLSGPDTAGTGSSWAAGLAKDETKRMKLITVHQYASGPTITIEQLLGANQTANQLKSVANNLAAANAAGLPIRIDEANSAFSGGVDGVSNKYASALWVIDYGLSMAQAGVAGVNIHGGLGVCNEPIWNGFFQRYTPFCAANKAYELAQIYKAMPIYYGIWMARQMGPGTFLPVQLTSTRNVTAYAVRGDDGRTRIALIQKDPTTAAPVQVTLNVGGRSRHAKVLRMTGTALNDEPTQIQGATVDAAGKLNPGAPDFAPVHNGVLTLSVAAGTAAVITLDR